MPKKPKKPQPSITQLRNVTASRIKAKYDALIAAIRTEGMRVKRKARSYYCPDLDYEAIAKRAKLLPPQKRQLLERCTKTVRKCLSESREILRDTRQRESIRIANVDDLMETVSAQRELCLLQVHGATLTPEELAVERRCKTFDEFYAEATKLGLDAKKIKKFVPRV